MQKKRDYSSERFQPKPRAFHLFTFRAGLLTYSRFGRLPISYKTVAADHPKAFMELTAAGLSRIYTWFPFHRFPIYRKPTPGGNTKVKIFIRKRSRVYRNISDNLYYLSLFLGDAGFLISIYTIGRLPKEGLFTMKF